MSRTRQIVKHGAKFTALAAALLVFSLILIFILGLVVDRLFVESHNF